MTDDDLDAMMSALGRAEPAPAIDAAAILARAATLVPPARPSRGLAGARLGAVLAGTSFVSALLGVVGAWFVLGQVPVRSIPVRVPFAVLVPPPAPPSAPPVASPSAVLERFPQSRAAVGRFPRGDALVSAGSCPVLAPSEPDGPADLDLSFGTDLGAPPALAASRDEDAQITVPGLTSPRKGDALRLVGGFEGQHPQVAGGFVHRGSGRTSWYAEGEIRVVPVPPTDPTMMDMQGVVHTWPVRAGAGAGLTVGADRRRLELGWTLGFGVTTTDALAHAAIENGPQLGVTVGALDRLHGLLSASVLLPVGSAGTPQMAGTGGIELAVGRRER